MAKLIVERGVLVERDIQRGGFFDNALLRAELDALAQHALDHGGHRPEQRLDEPQGEDDGYGHHQVGPVADARCGREDTVDDHLGRVDDRCGNERGDDHDGATDREQLRRDDPEEAVHARHDTHDIAQFSTHAGVEGTEVLVHQRVGAEVRRFYAWYALGTSGGYGEGLRV